MKVIDIGEVHTRATGEITDDVIGDADDCAISEVGKNTIAATANRPNAVVVHNSIVANGDGVSGTIDNYQVVLDRGSIVNGVDSDAYETAIVDKIVDELAATATKTTAVEVAAHSGPEVLPGGAGDRDSGRGGMKFAGIDTLKATKFNNVGIACVTEAQIFDVDMRAGRGDDAEIAAIAIQLASTPIVFDGVVPTAPTFRPLMLR